MVSLGCPDDPPSSAVDRAVIVIAMDGDRAVQCRVVKLTLKGGKVATDSPITLRTAASRHRFFPWAGSSGVPETVPELRIYSASSVADNESR